MRLHPSRKPTKKTQPHLQERGRQHRTQRLHYKRRTTRTMRRARSRTYPTSSPTTRSTSRRPRNPTRQRTTRIRSSTCPTACPTTRTTCRRPRSLTGDGTPRTRGVPTNKKAWTPSPEPKTTAEPQLQQTLETVETENGDLLCLLDNNAQLNQRGSRLQDAGDAEGRNHSHTQAP